MKRSIIIFAFFLSSCAGRDDATNIFRYNESSGIASLDPAFARNQSIMWAVNQLYSTLVEVDENLEIQGHLARRWIASPDKKTLTFYLRNDVRFHDDPCFPGGKGRLLTAKDVEYSYNRLMDPATASPGAWVFNDRVDRLKPFETIDDTTFILRLSKPFPPMLGILSMKYCSVIPREAVEYYKSDFRKRPVGTGPFRFHVWDEGQVLLLKRNEHYFLKDPGGTALPYLDGIKISFFDSKATEFVEFRQGRLDFINDIEASFKDEVLTRTGKLKSKWEGKIRLNKHPYLNTEYLGILNAGHSLMSNSPLREKRIRQAINYAIDRKKMMMYLRNSIGTAAGSGFIPAGLPSFNEQLKGYDFDPERARKLLQESGYNNEEIILHTIPQYANLATFIANDLRNIGINLKVEAVQKSVLLDLTSRSASQFFRGSWIADYPDAENYLSVFYGRNPAPPNYTRYNNPDYDRLYEEALEELDDQKRYALYRSMDSMIIQDAYVVPLWYDMVIHLVQPGISGFQPNSLNMLELRTAKRLLPPGD